jgi:non-ribosomal peptide synthetase component F
MTVPDTGASVALRVAGLPAAERAVLEKALLARRDRAEHAGRIPRRDPAAPVPLSFAQRGMWFLDQWQPGSALYGVRVALRLSGALDVPALRQAFDEVARRHEILRTTFRAAGGIPFQVVEDPSPRPVPVVDVGPLDGSRRDRVVGELLAAAAARPYDLATGPLLRAGLIRSGATEHVLFMSMHHIVADGWSYALLINELSAAYAAYRTGAQPVLSPLPLQYGDYATWQHRGVQDADLQWWKSALAGAPPLLRLPADRPRPHAPTYRAGVADVRIGPQLLGAVHALARQEGATLFMTLLAGFTALLHRYTEATDLVVGTPVAGRVDTQLEELIGCFVNTLALRTDLSGEPSFTALLGRVREGTLAAYAHQSVPFEQLVEELRLDRSTSYSPVFQVMFALGNTPPMVWDLPGLAVQPLGVAQLAEPFDLSMTVSEDGDSLDVNVTYSRDLFDPATIARLLLHFEELLAEVTAAPQRSIGALPRYGTTDGVPTQHEVPDEPAPTPAVPAPLVAAVRDIWREVLGSDAITGETHFFTAGGHSLLAVQVTARVRHSTGADLPVRAIFEAPTLTAFAGRVHAAAHAGGDTGAPPLVAAIRRGPVPLSRAQRRIWYVDQFDRGGAHHNVAAVLDIDGPLRVPDLRAAVAALRRRHESLRTTFERHGGQVEQVVAADAAVATVLVDLAPLGDRAVAEAGRLTEAEALRPFDLTRDPLWRVTVLRLGPDRHVLLSTIHHIVTDAWSSALLFEELWTLYAAPATQLPPLPVQYADYAIWEQQAADGPPLRRAEEYWRRQLDGAPDVLELEHDRPPPMTPVFAAATVPYTLGEHQTRDLVRLSLDQGVTVFMTVLTAYLILLRQRARTSDLVVGTGAANRPHVELEHVVGFFTNQLVLRTLVTGQETVSELLARVREVTLEAYTHETMPFDRLVELLRPARTVNRPPLFQVEIEYHRRTDDPPAPAGLTVSARDLHSPTTTLDLSLHVVQTATLVHGGLVYNADVFTAGSARRMVGQFRHLLAVMALAPDAPVEDVAAQAEERWRAEAARQRAEAARARFLDVNAAPAGVRLDHGGG